MSNTRDNFETVMEELRRYSNGYMKTAGSWVMIRCPFHNDPTPSCGINVSHTSGSKAFNFNCFAGETKVITSKGTFPIRELKGTHWVTSGGRWVKAKFDTYGIQRLYKITLVRNGTYKDIYATRDHRWFVSRIDHRLVPGKVAHFTGERITIDLVPGSYLKSSIPQLQDVKLDKTGIQHGFVFGDGTAPKKSKYSRAYICGEKRNFMPKYFNGLSPYVYKYDDRIIVDKLPIEWKQLPSINKDFAYLYGFLAGYIAADGCVAIDGTIVVHNKHKENLESLRDIANRLGIVTTDIKGSAKRTTNFSKNKKNKNSLYHLYFYRNLFPSELLLNPKHIERFNKRLCAKTRLGWKVVSVEKSNRKEEVFCCNVPKYHTFTLEDYILTGNCLGCGEKGSWNKLAKQAGLEEIKVWKTSATPESLLTADLDDQLVGMPLLTKRSVLEKLGCPEAQPWPANIDWRGFSGRLLSRVGALIAYDGYKDSVQVVFLIKYAGQLRGGVKATYERTVTKGQPAYIAMKGPWVNKYGLLFYTQAKTILERRNYKFLILVEGPRDALRLLSLGIPSVAVLGAATMTKSKAMMITSLDVDIVYIMPDNDRGGDTFWATARTALKDILPYKRITLPKTNEHGQVVKIDPGNMSSKLEQELIKFLKKNNDFHQPRPRKALDE